MRQSKREHWEKVWATHHPEGVSWYAPHLAESLRLIREVAAPHDSVIDVGGGASTLVDDLLGAGFLHLTVLDISETALSLARARLGERARPVMWLHADITTATLPEAAYDVWHDRAVFHFLTEPAQRSAYVERVRTSVRPGGHVIVATFGPEGPTKCSGLDVVRYDAASLHDEFGGKFRLIESETELHETPFGATQQFLYCLCRIE